MVHLFELTLGFHDFLSLRHKEVHHIHRFTQQTASIASQVNDQRSSSLLLQFHQSTLHFFGTAFHGESANIDITDAVVKHSEIWHRIGTNGSTRHLEFHRHISTVRGRTFYLYNTKGTRIPTEIIAHIRSQIIRNTIALCHILPIDLHDDITRLQTSLSSRIPFRWFNDSHSFPGSIIADDRSDTTKLTGRHFLQGIVFFRIIFRIRVGFCQHSTNTIFHHLFRINRIYIEHIQFLEHGIKHIQTFNNLKIPVIFFVETKEYTTYQEDTYTYADEFSVSFHTLFI